VVVEKDREDQLDREIDITWSPGGEEYPTCNKNKED
jgi:hypothetical protein